MSAQNHQRTNSGRSEFTPIKRMDDSAEPRRIAGTYPTLHRRKARYAPETKATAREEIQELRKQEDAFRQNAEAAAAASLTAGTLKGQGFNAVGA